MKKLESTLTNMVIVLTVVTIIAGGLLAFVNNITKDTISEINEKKLQDGIKKVIVGEKASEIKIQATDRSQEGYVIYITDKGTAVETSTNGFGGPLKVLVGFDDSGKIMGYEILSTAETPGLGVKAETWFQKGGKGNIIGLKPGDEELAVTKDGGKIDAITASTITSRAFLKAVNDAYLAFKKTQVTVEPSSDSQSGASQQRPEAIDSTKTDSQSGASQQKPEDKH